MNIGKHWVRVSCVALLTAAAALAQATSGSISGTITDPNGAVIPGAKVIATHEPTGRDYTTNATEAGLYVFPTLPVGPYTVTVTQPGFKKSVRTGIEVRLAIRTDIDLRLDIGEVTESVDVRAEAPLLETTTALRGQNVTPQLMASLPLWNGSLRNAESFVGYMPGVNSNGEQSFNGSIGRAKDVLIDGASIISPESGGIVMAFPGFEAFGEFKLITASFNAEYGRLGGGLETFVTKSGGNQIHGSAFLNIKRDIFNAATWASNANPANKPGYRPKERFNEEGGTAGGPVYIPKVYDGRNKSFFFFTYAKIVQPVSIAVNGGETVPTALQKQGIFTEVAAIYDPATTAGNTRQPFAGNIIPKNRWSKISSNILPYIPDPMSSSVTGNYSYIQSTMVDDYIWTLKLDHSITPNNRVAFLVTYRNSLSNSDQFLPGPLSNGFASYNKPDIYRVNHDWVIRPTMLLHTTFGFSQDKATWQNPLQNGFASRIGLPLTSNADATPVISFETDNLTAWGQNQGKVNNGGQWNWTTMVTQALTWTRGSHEFKLGLDIRRMRTISDDWASSNGAYGFNRAQTASPAALTTTGNAFASFLLGEANSGSALATPITPLQARYGYHAGYFQDTWRVRPRFTLDYGVRYEVPIGWHDVNGNYTSLDLNAPNPAANNLPGALVYAGTGAGRSGQKRLYPTDYSSIGPRGGFAWRVGEKTVIRGGFGIYYQTLGNGGCGCTDGFNGKFSQSSDGVNAAFNWDQGGVKPPAGFKTPPRIDPSFDNFYSGVVRMGPNFGHAPRIYNWSLTIQREYRNWLFEVAYVGNRGHGLNSTVFLNQIPTSSLALGSLLTKNILDPAVVAAGYKEPFPGFAAGWKGGATLAQALRPYPQFGNVYDANAGVGKTWYDSMQSKIERRFGSFNFMASYVWSKSLSLMTYRQIFSQGSNVQAQDAYNIADAKSFSFMDFPHYVNVLYSWDLPFGKGRKWLGNAGRVFNLVAGGWTVAGTGQYRSGSLIQIFTNGNPLAATTFAPVTRANATGSPIRTGVSSTDLDPNNPNIRWFNFGANAPYTVASALSLGSASMFNSEFRNPWLRTENMSIVKNLSLWESVRLQIRADAFNIFNRTAFGGINGTVGNANFGRAQAVQVGARAINMGLRLEF